MCVGRCCGCCGCVWEWQVQPGWRAATSAASGHNTAGGVGSALLSHAESAFMAAGVNVMKLQVAAGNAGALAFYERRGLETRQVLMFKELGHGSRRATL